MAHYLVRARPRQTRLAQLARELEASTFIDLQPFGRALTKGLCDARIDPGGDALWEEEDYCSPPLAEERAAVLDAYFDDIRVEPVARGDGWRAVEGLPRLFGAVGGT